MKQMLILELNNSWLILFDMNQQNMPVFSILQDKSVTKLKLFIKSLQEENYEETDPVESRQRK